jgi:hypothetical protein
MAPKKTIKLSKEHSIQVYEKSILGFGGTPLFFNRTPQQKEMLDSL